jgi:hypothetical protein
VVTRNRFNGFRRHQVSAQTHFHELEEEQTVKTVLLLLVPSVTGLKPGVNESSAARAQLQMEQSRTSQMPGEKCDANEVARGCLQFS